MKKIIGGVMIGSLLAVSLPASAEHRGRHWEGREIHRFHEHDVQIWRGGHWHHGRHAGRLGWWWIAAGVWYFYPAPVYPYPDPYVPPVVVSPPVIVAPQTTVPAPAPAPAQPPAQYWYYCDSAKGYYPYVPNCPEPWRQVPAQPPQAAPR